MEETGPRQLGIMLVKRQDTVNDNEIVQAKILNSTGIQNDKRRRNSSKLLQVTLGQFLSSL